MTAAIEAASVTVAALAERLVTLTSTATLGSIAIRIARRGTIVAGGWRSSKIFSGCIRCVPLSTAALKGLLVLVDLVWSTGLASFRAYLSLEVLHRMRLS